MILWNIPGVKRRRLLHTRGHQARDKDLKDTTGLGCAAGGDWEKSQVGTGGVRRDRSGFVTFPQGQFHAGLWGWALLGLFLLAGLGGELGIHQFLHTEFPEVLLGQPQALAVVETILFQQEGEKNLAPAACPVEQLCVQGCEDLPLKKEPGHKQC